MKALVIYFSQTNNTRKVAQCIHAGITESTMESRLVPLAEVDQNTLADYDLVGLGAPVFYYQEPFNVQDFIEALPDLKGQPWFVFCTHGNIIGNFFPSIAAKLSKKGASVMGFHHSFAGISVPFYPKPSYTSGHPDDADLDAAHRFGGKMVETVFKLKQNSRIPLPDPLPVSSKEWIETSYKLTVKRLSKILPKLSLNTQTCTQCHACETQCPVNGIDMSANPVRLQTPCIFCWNCVNICPTLSITADWEPLVKAAPATYALYKKELDQLVAEGRFRWLLAPETIDLTNPLYKQREQKLKQKKESNS